MTVERTLIDCQLARMYAVIREACASEEIFLLQRRIILYWSDLAVRSRTSRDRERANRAARRNRDLVASLRTWHCWLRRDRDKVAELRAKQSIAEARRLSRALRRLHQSCLRRRRVRGVRRTLRILQKFSLQRPLRPRWNHWHEVVLYVRLRKIFDAWVEVVQRVCQVRRAASLVIARKKGHTLALIWKRWNRMAAASTLGRLLQALEVIGPSRKALDVMRGVTVITRAKQQRRRWQLRRGFQEGFRSVLKSQRRVARAGSVARNRFREQRLHRGFLTFRLNVRATAACTHIEMQAVDEYRRQALHRAMARWMTQHHNSARISNFQKCSTRRKRRINIKTWAEEAAAISRSRQVLKEKIERHTRTTGMGRLRQAVTRRRTQRWTSVATTTIANAKLRQTLLGRGVKHWFGRVQTIQENSRCQLMASRFTRLRSLRRGMRCLGDWAKEKNSARYALHTTRISRLARAILRWRERIKDLRALSEAETAYNARAYTLAVYRWRRCIIHLENQRGLRGLALSFYCRRSLAAAMRFWWDRVGHVLDMRTTICNFQMRRGTKLGVFGLQRWTEGRKITRVLSWRARIWAETFLGRRALDEWWRHIRHQRDVEASVWITENRMKRWKIARFDISPSVMQHTVVRTLDKNALANRLQRAVLRAWVERTQLVAKARQKVRSFYLHSGLKGFRLWARSMRHRRERHLHASRQTVSGIKRMTFVAWKYHIFSWGYEFSYRSHGSSLACSAQVPNDTAMMGVQLTRNDSNASNLPPREPKSLGVAAPSKFCAWAAPVGVRSMVVFHCLPMIRKRMERVLNEWRRLTIQEKRLRYIEDVLPAKTMCVRHESPHNSDFMGVDNPFHSSEQSGAPRSQERVSVGEKEEKRASRKHFGKDASVEEKEGIYVPHNDQGGDHVLEPAIEKTRRLTRGSYLQLHLMRTSYT